MHTASHRFRLSLITAMVIALISPRVFAVEPKQIDESIRKGRDYLYSQYKDGSWEKVVAPDPAKDRTEPEGGQWGGTTALCVYALLSAGESHEEPRIKSAIDFLTQADMKGVYAVAMRTQVLAMIPKSE